MAGLSREVIRWLQSLDLSWQVKVPKWDFSNGYLIAEIFSWYYPQDIQMHNYNKGDSLDLKTRNWSLLKNLVKRHHLEVPEDYVDGTIHCKEGAAAALIETLYTLLTNRQLKRKDGHQVDFTDLAYQEKLPFHARSTASTSIKNNLKATEIDANKNLTTIQTNVEVIVMRHVNQRRAEREVDPKRFNIKPSLGERSLRRPPPRIVPSSGDAISRDGAKQADYDDKTYKGDAEERQQDIAAVKFQEKSVKQMKTRPAAQAPPGGGVAAS